MRVLNECQSRSCPMSLEMFSLPPSNWDSSLAIFKYFTEESHATAFLENGAMLFRPLTYFRAYEDGHVRGDPDDGKLTYAPSVGLELTKQDGTKLNLAGWRFTSTAQDQILVFCASNQLSHELAERFDSPYCVEVSEPERLIERLRKRAHPSSQLDYDELVSGSVEYRGHDAEPGADWAQPDRLAFLKPEAFAWQDEYRIAIGHRGAFDPQNVACSLEMVGSLASTPQAAQTAPMLKINAIAEFAELHRL